MGDIAIQVEHLGKRYHIGERMNYTVLRETLTKRGTRFFARRHPSEETMCSSLQVPRADHYDHAYDSKPRFASYWHQVDECQAIGGKSVLLVGKGSGLTQLLLERQGFKVTTADLQAELDPTVVTDVRRLPFLDRAFDLAVCCQVLEHLPFEFFVPSLYELRRVIRRGLVLSLPDQGCYSKSIPYLLSRFLFKRKAVMALPNLWLKPQEFKGGHFWEVNTRDCRLRKIDQAINKAGLKIEYSFRVWEFPYHRFWRLRVLGSDGLREIYKED